MHARCRLKDEWVTMLLEATGILTIMGALHFGVRAAIRRGFRIPNQDHQTTPDKYGLPARDVTIDTANGKQLFGWLITVSSGLPAPTILVMHGWRANAALMLSAVRSLHQAGYALLLIDARCHGRSEDDQFSSMPRFAEDVEHAMDWLARQPEIDPRRIVLLGHSVGAGAVLMVSARRHGIAAVVSVSAFAHPKEVMLRLLSRQHLPYMPFGWYVIQQVQRLIGYRFDDIAPEHTIKLGDCPVLLAHGIKDEVVPFADAQRLLTAGLKANRPVQLLALEGDHELSNALLQHEATLLDFLSRACGTETTAPQYPGKKRLSDPCH